MKRLSFWDRVTKGTPEECWPWQGYRGPSGHGATTFQSLPIYASRKAWILTHGPIHGGLCVNHRCDNKLCCNPAHLYLGTRADNMIDRWRNTAPDERRAFGRPHVLDAEELERLWERRRNGATLRECAKEFHVHVATICRCITTVRKQKLEQNRSARLSAVAKVML